MNEPIISPWIFYLVGVCSKIQFICGLMMLSGALASIVGFISYVSSRYKDETKLKWFKYILFAELGICCVHVLIPSKETLLHMVVASYITPENLNIVGGTVEQITTKVTAIITDSVTKIIQSTK